MVASGLGLFWVMVPVVPWSLEMGTGTQLGTGHALRSERGGGFRFPIVKTTIKSGGKRPRDKIKYALKYNSTCKFKT